MTAPTPQQPSRTQIWSARLAAVVQVLFFIEAGIILILFPWTPVWSRNSLLAGHIALQHIVYSGFIRGVISGVGLLNLWFGAQTALTYSDPKLPHAVQDDKHSPHTQ